jgi:hypothetical protein
MGRDTLADGAIPIGIDDVISGDSLFGRHQGAARVGAEPVPREDYLPRLGHPAERIALPSGPRSARWLLGPG